MHDPYHSGERAIQEMTGERGTAVLNARGIGDAIPPGALSFLARQQLCVLGWASPVGEVWASVIARRDGFARTDSDRRMLVLHLKDDIATPSDDRLLAELREGDLLGVLFIELPTRRRLRVKGRIANSADGELTLAIDQAYANCPKYIQRRTVEIASEGGAQAPNSIESGDALTAELRAWIERADTVFVASAHPNGAADISHRGGAPGFVRLRGDALRIPDYPGNSMFNTLGNFQLNPRAGLAFVDFSANRQLMLTGRVSLDLNAGEADGTTGGTGRWWTFTPMRWIAAPLHAALRWGSPEPSPFNPRTD